jgi:DNA polymerase-3 subunit gamma/tau
VAEQLGAARPVAPGEGQDWARQAASTAAPAWVTSEAPVVPPRQVRTRAGASPAGAGPATGSAPGSVTGSAAGVSSAPRGTADPTPVETGSSSSPDAPRPDDEDLASSGAVGQPVIENVLGGRVIAINDDPVG